MLMAGKINRETVGWMEPDPHTEPLAFGRAFLASLTDAVDRGAGCADVISVALCSIRAKIIPQKIFRVRHGATSRKSHGQRRQDAPPRRAKSRRPRGVVRCRLRRPQGRPGRGRRQGRLTTRETSSAPLLAALGPRLPPSGGSSWKGDTFFPPRRRYCRRPRARLEQQRQGGRIVRRRGPLRVPAGSGTGTR